ncbi:MAG: beta-ketoacyl-ACP synthase II [Chloroflexi bacterium]|nr:beta-ketoacyl-ACP synthase II [Chloroflexota bacterium]
MSGPRRVVVTGIGLLTPVGLDVESSWKNLLAGTSGIDLIKRFDTTQQQVKIAGEIEDFEPKQYMDHKMARRSGRFAQLAVAASKQALCSAAVEIDDSNRDEIGVIIASAGGVFEMGNQEHVIETRGAHRVNPLLITKYGAYMAAARVGRVLGVRGPNSTINSACASGTDALGQALNMIQNGAADVLLAGAAEAVVTPVGIATMGVLGALTKEGNDDPQRASRPFDATRTGFVLAEGAGMLLLETEERAQERGAPILAEFAGAGWSFDAADDTAPDSAGQALAMQRALRSAGLKPEDVSYINAHGTSTQLNDKAETAAIKIAFGEQEARRVPISSIKSMIGHSGSGAGGVEAVVAVLTIRDNMLPPTINYEHPDPECDLDYVPNEARAHEVDVVLSNSFGLGGQNGSLVMRRYHE